MSNTMMEIMRKLLFQIMQINAMLHDRNFPHVSFALVPDLTFPHLPSLYIEQMHFLYLEIYERSFMENCIDFSIRTSELCQLDIGRGRS